MIAVDARDAGGDLRLVEASWALPGRETPFDPYLRGTFASVDTDSIKAVPITDRLDAAQSAFGKAGLDGADPVAVYDRVGLFSSPWIWWLLRSFGCDARLVEGWGDTTLEPPLAAPTTFVPSRDPGDYNATRDQVLAALCSHIQILDARPAARFTGTAPEPRRECRSGHIPGSLNIPFPNLKDRRAFKTADQLSQLFEDAEVDLGKPIITTCGSGVTASGLAFALTRCGAEDVRVYQGSWAEWGVDADLPVETGP
ncbi:MAG: rhodanese-like domain-containing protein [Pseudomonadota bacterium]